MSKNRKWPKCPICKTGKMIEDIPGAHCSRRNARRKPCNFACGMYSSPAEYREYIKNWRVADARSRAYHRVEKAEEAVVEAARTWRSGFRADRERVLIDAVDELEAAVEAVQ